MKTLTMLDFRLRAGEVIKRVRSGERMILTYRGKPAFRIEPVDDGKIDKNDAFYSLIDRADDSGESLSNEEMDRIVYER